METVWKTQKGDEWSYQQQSIHAFADLYKDEVEDLFAIRDIYNPEGQLTEQDLLLLLGEAKEYFACVSLLIKLRPDAYDVERNLKSLQDKGLISYVISSPASSRFEHIRSIVVVPNSFRIAEVSVLASEKQY